MRRRLSRADRVRVVALLLCALLVRAMVPTGWMPVATAHGLSFALCAGQEPAPHAVTAMHHGQKEHGGQAMPDHPCAFAGLGLAADTAPPPLAMPAMSVAIEAAPARVLAATVGRGLAAPPPPATGPPAYA